MHVNRHLCGFSGAITQSESRNHIPLGSGAKSGATALEGLGSDFFPEVKFGLLDFGGLGVSLDLTYYGVNLLHLQVDYIVHNALSLGNMPGKKFVIELGMIRERILYIGVEIDG